MIVGVSVVVFVATRMIGDPVRLMLPLQATPEQVVLARTQYGFDRPLIEQLATFVRGAASGDFGVSLWQGESALGLVLARVPATFQLVIAAAITSWFIAVPLGVLASLRPGSKLDRVTTLISLGGVSAPNFWVAIILVIIFSGVLRLLPTSGYGTVQHLVLPALTLALLAGGRLAQVVRAAMIDEMRKPYIVTARAKGIGERRVLGHALRNARPAIIALAAWDLAFMLAGYTVPVEVVYAWPGVGQLAADAIAHRDLPLIQADVFVVAIVVVAVNLLADVAHAAADPRVRLG